MMERGTEVLGDEFEKSLSPRIIGVTEDLFPSAFSSSMLTRTNGFGDDFAALLVEILKIEFFERHRAQSIPFK